jgi:hypothetical protein
LSVRLARYWRFAAKGPVSQTTPIRSTEMTAAWILAERSELEERATIASNWARRAVILSPFDERVVRKALALLGRLGDRAGAVSLYESFRQRLAREYEVEPCARDGRTDATDPGAIAVRQVRIRRRANDG